MLWWSNQRYIVKKDQLCSVPRHNVFKHGNENLQFLSHGNRDTRFSLSKNLIHEPKSTNVITIWFLLFSMQRLCSTESPYQSVPQCNPTQPTPFADTSTNITATTAVAAAAATTNNNCPFLDSSASLLLQRPNTFFQVYISDLIC